MKIAVMSDLHLEFECWRLGDETWREFVAARDAIPGHPHIGPRIDTAVGADLVILAEDIDVGARGNGYDEAVARFTGASVVDVAGNHEFYDCAIDLLPDKLRATASKTGRRVAFLENQAAFSGSAMSEFMSSARRSGRIMVQTSAKKLASRWRRRPTA